MLLKNWLYRNKVRPTNSLSLWAGGFLPALLYVWLPVIGKAQVNLVQNPSFENISSCPTNYDQIKLAVGWDTLKNGGGGGPEAFNACANPNNNFGVPSNTFGMSYQIANTGTSYANLSFYVEPSFYKQREYLQTKLIFPLIQGKSYCVTFYVSLNNRSQYAVDELGAYFDNGTISTPPYGIFLANPQIKSPSGTIYSDTLNWMKVQGSFTASGIFTYLTLGNFRSNANTNNILMYANAAGVVAEYYIDDVSVIDINTPANAGRDTLICKTDSIFIGRPDEIGLDCSWFLNNSQIGTGTGIWVKPETTSNYIVRQDLCGVLSYDTLTVSVKDEDCYSTIITIPNIFTPNEDGINDAWRFEVKHATDIKYAVYNRWGNLIKDSNLPFQTVVSWDGRTTAGEACPAGVYFYVLTYTDAKGDPQKKNGYLTLMK